MSDLSLRLGRLVAGFGMPQPMRTGGADGDGDGDGGGDEHSGMGQSELDMSGDSKVSDDMPSPPRRVPPQPSSPQRSPHESVASMANHSDGVAQRSGDGIDHSHGGGHPDDAGTPASRRSVDDTSVRSSTDDDVGRGDDLDWADRWLHGLAPGSTRHVVRVRLTHPCDGQYVSPRQPGQWAGDWGCYVTYRFVAASPSLTGQSPPTCDGLWLDGTGGLQKCEGLVHVLWWSDRSARRSTFGVHAVDLPMGHHAAAIVPAGRRGMELQVWRPPRPDAQGDQVPGEGPTTAEFVGSAFLSRKNLMLVLETQGTVSLALPVHGSARFGASGKPMRLPVSFSYTSIDGDADTAAQGGDGADSGPADGDGADGAGAGTGAGGGAGASHDQGTASAATPGAQGGHGDHDSGSGAQATSHGAAATESSALAMGVHPAATPQALSTGPQRTLRLRLRQVSGTAPPGSKFRVRVRAFDGEKYVALLSQDHVYGVAMEALLPVALNSKFVQFLLQGSLAVQLCVVPNAYTSPLDGQRRPAHHDVGVVASEAHVALRDLLRSSSGINSRVDLAQEEHLVPRAPAVGNAKFQVGIMFQHNMPHEASGDQLPAGSAFVTPSGASRKAAGGTPSASDRSVSSGDDWSPLPGPVSVQNLTDSSADVSSSSHGTLPGSDAAVGSRGQDVSQLSSIPVIDDVDTEEHAATGAADADAGAGGGQVALADDQAVRRTPRVAAASGSGGEATVQTAPAAGGGDDPPSAIASADVQPSHDVDTSRRSSLFSVSEPVRRGSGSGGSPDGERVPRWTRVEVMVEEAVNLRSPGVYYVLYRWPQVPAGELGTAVSRCSEKGAAVWNHAHSLFVPTAKQYWRRLRGQPFAVPDPRDATQREEMVTTHLVLRLLRCADHATRSADGLDEEVGCAFVDVSVLALSAFNGLVDGWYDVVNTDGEIEVRAASRLLFASPAGAHRGVLLVSRAA